MIKVSGLPVNITKSDLDELFFAYGTIQITKNSVIIKIKQTESIAHLELDKNEPLAIEELDRRKWRDYILYLDPIRGDGILPSQDEGGGNQNQAGGDRVKKGQPGGGGNQNQASGNPK
ncbi:MULTISPECIES: hypothetical protein [unclassified Microcoleus]|uniref:hypothetical protein n=1 Tax=unclassified Microcoleus TaxID=2642155 RepID=UPI002FD0A273